MKMIWSGSISFGLINIPIKLYPAIQEHTFGFKVLCGKCHNPLAYRHWCTHCKKEVAWENTVKGFQQEDGSFIVLTKEQIKALRSAKTSTIDIKEFVDQEAIKTVYINGHYYMVPAKKEIKAFFLFFKALKKANKVAIGTFVMHEKEHVVAITPYENTLLLNTLHYAYEIRSLDTIQAELESKTKVDTEELKLAQQLINQLSHKVFNIGKYKDTFIARLKKELSALKKGKKVKKPKPTKRTAAKKKSLVDTLRASVHQEEARA
ncbi:MAG TPA: Ku protein [Candidatus Babeliales bacterium]|jgi:DNA end-binding protein Ku|nr:Ku protein [Candidatus Babeliales bacterium]